MALFESQAGIIHPLLVEVGVQAIGRARPDHLRHRIRQRAEDFGTLLQRDLCLSLVRDVDTDDQIANRVARGIVATCHDNVGREPRAILPHALELRLRNTLVVRCLEQLVSRTRSSVFRRMQDVLVPADDFIGSVAVVAPRALVPSRILRSRSSLMMEYLVELARMLSRKALVSASFSSRLRLVMQYAMSSASSVRIRNSCSSNASGRPE